jgi:hypothetical protein
MIGRPKTLGPLAGLSVGRRRRLHGAAGSVAVHLLLIGALLLHWSHAPLGVDGADLGTGIDVSLVDGFAAGGADVGRISERDATAEEHRDRNFQSDPAAGASASDAALPSLTEEQSLERLKAETALDVGSAGETAANEHGYDGDSAARGGDPTPGADLLQQIARCLPPNYRPNLGFSSLVVSIGDNGALRAAPQVTSRLPQMTAEDRLAADRIVQAALLCGPYNKPNLLNQVISLAADFSAIQPRVATAGADGGQQTARAN